MNTYTTYQPTNITWLGDIPSHWELKRIAGFFTERRQKVSDKDFSPLSVTKHGIFPQWENVAKSNDNDNRKLVRKGDFVINSRSDRKGSSGLAKQDGSVSLINIVLEPKNINPRYVEYLFKSYNFIEEFYRVGHGIVADLWTTRFDDIKNSLMAVPPLTEQTAIADYLDKKTTQIQTAIRLKREQIDRLKEYRQALINQTVTQGLNPSVPMKNSGIEWLGDVPEHWEVLALKRVARIKNGLDYKQFEALDGYPVFGSGGQFAHSSKYLYDGEAILLGRKGTIDKPLYVNQKFWTVDTMFYCICNKNVLTKFIYYQCLTIPFAYYSTATALPSMTQFDLLNHKIGLPPLPEQTAIAEFLDKKTAQIDTALATYQAQIDKLNEYQRSLVNDVVTGKIDVRTI